MRDALVEPQMQGSRLFDVGNMNEMQLMCYRPPVFGNMSDTQLQFDFSMYNQIAPSFPPPNSFAFENAENEAASRRKDRHLDCRKRRFPGMLLPGCPPAKRKRNGHFQRDISPPKTAVFDAEKYSVGCTNFNSVPSAENGYGNVLKEPSLLPFQTELPDTTTKLQAPTSPNELFTYWQPFNAEPEPCDVEMCNAEMQGLNIIPSVQEPVQLAIDIQDFKPEHITVTTADNELVISGKRQVIQEKNVVQHKFSHTYSLPSHFDADRIVANFPASGKLSLLCPQIENYTGVKEGAIVLETIDNDRTVIKRNWEVPAAQKTVKFGL